MEPKKKEKKILKKVLIGIGILFVILVTLFIVMVIKDLQQEALLKQEIIDYSNKDLATDNFNIEIKTKGDYAYIEEAVKKYYKKLSDNVKEISSYLNKDEFTKILSPENLIKDHPDFVLSHATVKNVKEKMKNLLGNIEELCDEKTIKDLIDKEKLSDEDYYYELYEKLMYTKKDLKELASVKEEMQQLSMTLTEFLDKIDEILTYLQINNSKIEYKNTGIFFATDEALVGYKKLLTELQTIANKFTNNSTTKSDKDKQMEI